MASMIWKCIDSPKREKFKAVNFVNKIMATDFSDARDVLLDFLSKSEKIIAAGYCNVLLLAGGRWNFSSLLAGGSCICLTYACCCTCSSDFLMMDSKTIENMQSVL
jgi:hypothetical protein